MSNDALFDMQLLSLSNVVAVHRAAIDRSLPSVENVWQIGDVLFSTQMGTLLPMGQVSGDAVIPFTPSTYPTALKLAQLEKQLIEEIRAVDPTATLRPLSEKLISDCANNITQALQRLKDDKDLIISVAKQLKNPPDDTDVFSEFFSHLNITRIEQGFDSSVGALEALNKLLVGNRNKGSLLKESHVE